MAAEILTAPTDRVDTELLAQAEAIVLREMRMWDDDEDYPVGAFATEFSTFDPLN